MAVKCVGREWCPLFKTFRKSFVLDADSDAVELPDCCPGSTAVVAAAGGAVYMVNASGEWRAL